MTTPYLYLTEDTLGTLNLGPVVDDVTGIQSCGDHGFVVTDWNVGFPQVRAVVRNKALSDGVFDDSRYRGQRAFSMSLVIDQRKADPQLIIDSLMPYLSPRYRPRLHFALPGSDQLRSCVVRGVDAPISVVRRKFHALLASWVSAGNGLMEGDEECVLITPGSDTEDGRHYDDGVTPDDAYGPYYTNSGGSVDRAYPFSLALGDRIVVNQGNAPVDWTCTIFGSAVEPAITINGVTVSFDQNGGLTVGAGQSLVMDTAAATFLLNGDPDESRFSYSNFTAWTFDQIRLQPGINVVRFSGDTLGDAASAQFCFRSGWL